MTIISPAAFDQTGRPLYDCPDCGHMHNVTVEWRRSMSAELDRSSRQDEKQGRTVNTGVGGRGKPARKRWSEKQLRYALSLCEWIGEHDAGLRATLATMVTESHVTGKGHPSGIIDTLKSTLDELKRRSAADRAEQRVAAREDDRPEVPAGRYAVDTISDDATNRTMFVKVWVGRTGFVKVYQQVSDTDAALPWGTARSVLARIAADGVEAATLRYGRELGVCGRCGRTLTNDTSRAAGIGPECSSKGF